MNILGNRIGTDQANALIKIMEGKSTLKTLCGFSGNETELDLSKKGLTAGCALLVANEIVANGALTSLNISNSQLTRGKPNGKIYVDEYLNYETDFSGEGQHT